MVSADTAETQLLGGALLSSSVTPIYYNNPGFRYFTYESGPPAFLKDYSHRFMDLREVGWLAVLLCVLLATDGRETGTAHRRASMEGGVLV